MADNTIDTLSLEIVSSSSQANKALDNLAKKLLNMNKALQAVNTGGLRNYARDMGRVSASIKAINGIKANVPNLGGLTKQLGDLAKIDFSKLSSSEQPLKGFASGIRSLSGLQNISIPKLETKNINSVINAVEKLQGIDTAKIPQISDGLSRISHAMSVLNTVNFSDSKITTVIGALNRLLSVDTTGFDTTIFTGISTAIVSLANIPDVSNSLNRFISSMAKLAGTGQSIGTVSSQLPILGTALKETVNKMVSAGTVSEAVNLFVQSIGRLASAGSKTGKTAAELQNLAEETLKFFQAMSKAPMISENTIRMTQALAELASAGGKVNTATGTITGAFNKLSGLGAKTANTIKKAARGVVSSFKNIGNGSRQLNIASGSFGRLFRSALPFLSIYQLFNFGKKSMEIASDLTEVQNIVDVTFGSMSDKVEKFAQNSIQQFGMSELSVKQFASRFQAMGTAMGIDKSLIGSANDYLKEQTNGYIGASDAMADMSLNLTKLTADMASFYNVEQSAVAEDLESIFTGQTRPLRAYGLDLTQATLQEWAMKQGLDANIESMSQAEKTLLRYQYVLANTTAAQGDFTRTADTWANRVRVLVQQFQQLGAIIGGTLINAFKPFVAALNSVMQKVIAFAETVSEALGAIFGWKIEMGGGGVKNDLGDLSGGMEDVADSTGSAAGAAEKLKKTLSVLPFDQLNQLASDMDKAGSGGSGGGAGSGIGSGAVGGASAEIVPTDSILEAYESEIKTLEQLGEFIGDSLTNAMQKIDWDKVYAKAKNFGKGLANFLNGLISPSLFGETGKLIANSLNTALHSLNSFGETFDWEEFGVSIATGINSFFANYDFGLLADTATTWVNGILGTISKAVEELEWSDIGESIGKGVKRLFKKLDFDDAADIFINAFNGIFDGLKKFNAAKPFEGIGDRIAKAINKAIENMDVDEAIDAAGDFIQSVFDEMLSMIKKIKWDKVGKKIGDFLGGIDFSQVAKDLVELFWEAIKAGFSAWTGMFNAAPIETQILSAVGILKFTGVGSVVSKNIAKSIAKKMDIEFKSDDVGIGKALSLGLEKIISNNLGVIGKIGLVGTAITGIFAGVKAIINNDEAYQFYKTMEDAADASAKYLQSTKDRIGESKEYIENYGEAETRHAQNLADEYYELAEKGNLTNDEKRKMRDYASDLVDLIPDLAEHIDAETGMIKLQKDEVQKLIDKRKEQYKIEAAKEKIIEWNRQLLEAEERESEAVSNLSEAQRKYAEAQADVNEKRKAWQEAGLNDDVRYLEDQFTSAQVALDNKFGPALESAKTEVVNASSAVSDINSHIEELDSLIYSTSETAKQTDYSQMATNAQSAIDAMGGVFVNGRQVVGAEAEKIYYEIIDQFGTLGEDMYTLADGSSVQFGNAIRDNAGYIENEAENVGENTIQGYINGIEKKSGEVKKVSLKVVGESINTFVEKLGIHSPSTVFYGFGQNTIQGFINGTDSKSRSLVSTMMNLMNSSINSFNGIDTEFGTIGTSAMAGMNTGISKNTMMIVKQMASITSMMTKSFSSIGMQFSNIGKTMMSGLNDGISSSISSINFTINSIVRIMNGISGSLYQSGRNAAQSFADGFRSIHIPTPHLNISSWDRKRLGAGASMSIPNFKVNWYKAGGLFGNASVIGVGEAGEEAVLPLENQRVMSKIADSIMSNSSGMSIDEETLTNAVARGVAMAMINNQDNRPINLYATLYTENDEVLARAVTRGQEKIDYRMNPTPSFG